MSRSRLKVFTFLRQTGHWVWRLYDLGCPIRHGSEATQKAARAKGRLAKMEYLEQLQKSATPHEKPLTP